MPQQDLTNLEVWQLAREHSTSIPLAVTAGFVDDLLKHLEHKTALSADVRMYIVETLIPVLVPGITQFSMNILLSNHRCLQPSLSSAKRSKTTSGR